VSLAVAEPMARPKSEGPKLENAKLEQPTLDQARIVYAWLRSQLSEDERKPFMLATYLSQCIRGERNMADDYRKFLADQNRQHRGSK
jgi:hypothetical protein